MVDINYPGASTGIIYFIIVIDIESNQSLLVDLILSLFLAHAVFYILTVCGREDSGQFDVITRGCNIDFPEPLIGAYVKMGKTFFQKFLLNF